MNLAHPPKKATTPVFVILQDSILQRLEKKQYYALARYFRDEFCLQNITHEFLKLEGELTALPGPYSALTRDDLLRHTGKLQLRIDKNYLSCFLSPTPDENIGKILVASADNSDFNPLELIFTEKDDLPFFSDKNMLTTRDSNNIHQHLALASILSRFPHYTYVIEPPAFLNDDALKMVSFGIRRHFFTQIILGRRPSAGLRYLDQVGLLDSFLPEITAGKNLSQNRFHAHDIFEHLLRALDGAIEAKDYLRWSALLHDIGKVPTRLEKENGEASFHNHEMFSARMVVPIMKRLGISRETGQKVRFLVRNHMFHYTNEWSDKAVRRFVKKIPREDLQDLIALRMADRKGSGKKTEFPKALQKLINHIALLEEKEKEPKVSNLIINGNHLQQMGIRPGPLMGTILRQLLAETVTGHISNDMESLGKRAMELHDSLISAENKA